MTRVVAIIPALDEEACIAGVVRGIQQHVDVAVVVDNGSRDRTAEVAAAAGARVVVQTERGYGAACLRGIDEARALGADIVLFLDADGSDDPNDAPRLLSPVREGTADLVLGVRTRETIEDGAMTDVQRFGNWLAPALMRVTVGARYRDMPPFKAISRSMLDRLAVDDRGHGFTIQLLLRAHAEHARVREVPVRCRRRVGGVSKVSGTLRGTLRASSKILTSIARHAVVARLRPSIGTRRNA